MVYWLKLSACKKWVGFKNSISFNSLSVALAMGIIYILLHTLYLLDLINYNSIFPVRGVLNGCQVPYHYDLITMNHYNAPTL